jgi:uncharacterized coiled-coil DUF342 family protein
MSRTLLPKMFVRDLDREIDKASNALYRIMDLTDELREKLDTPDASTLALAACDDLEAVHDEAEEADNELTNLLDLTEKLRRYTRITRKAVRR